MINRKGFSLVEILAVIAIIAIVSVAAVPAVITIARNNKNNMFCKKIQTIEKSAQMYGSDQIVDIDEDELIDDNIKCELYVDNLAVAEKKHCQITTIYTLAENGYVNYEQAGKNTVKNEVIDPRNSSSMLTKKVMIYTVNKRVHAQYIYDSLKDALKCSDIIQAGNINMRELYYMDGTKYRNVNCESKDLATCEAMTH